LTSLTFDDDDELNPFYFPNLAAKPRNNNCLQELQDSYKSFSPSFTTSIGLQENNNNNNNNNRSSSNSDFGVIFSGQNQQLARQCKEEEMGSHNCCSFFFFGNSIINPHKRLLSHFSTTFVNDTRNVAIQFHPIIKNNCLKQM